MEFKIIGIIHFLGTMLIPLYGFLFKKNVFDKVYLFYTVIVITSWLFCKGECLISYYIKKMNDDNYILGSKASDLKDIYDLFNKKYIPIVNFMMKLSLVIHAFSMNIVFLRNDYPQLLSFIIPYLLIIYNILLKFKNKNLEVIYNLLKLSFSIILLYMMEKEKIIT